MHVIFVDELGHSNGPAVCTYKSPVVNNALFQLKQNFLKRFAPGASVNDLDKWSLTLNSVLIAQADMRKRLREFPPSETGFPYLFVMSYKQPLVVAPVQEEEEGGQEEYDISRRLRVIISGGIAAYINDSKSNGMITQRIFHYLNLIRVHMTRVRVPVDNFTIVTEDLPLERLLNRPGLVISPYLENATHTSLVVISNGNLLLHLDASSSCSKFNRQLFTCIGAEKVVQYSLTYVNYQHFDHEGQGNYPGGNCSCFSLYQTPRIIIEAEKYLKQERFTFDDFWSRFTRVCELTRDLDAVAEVCLTLITAIMYLYEGDGIANLCLDYEEQCYAMARPVVVTILKRSQGLDYMLKNVKHLLEPLTRRLNFCSDVLMLDIYIANDKGFKDVSFIGHAIYLFLQDVEKRGFVSMDLKKYFTGLRFLL